MPDVVKRSQGFATAFQLQFACSTRALTLPVGNVPVTLVVFGATSKNAAVEPEKFGLRSNTVPLLVPLANASKSVTNVSAFVVAVALFVNVSNAPSLIVLLAMTASTGGVLSGAAIRSSQFSGTQPILLLASNHCTRHQV